MKVRFLLVLVSALTAAEAPPAKAASRPESARPDNPSAIEPAKTLYAYLYDLSRSEASSGKLISGHWLGASFKPGNGYPFTMQEPLEIRRHTGKWIGMIDGWICPGEFGNDRGSDPIEDCMWYEDMIAEYTLWWNNGGIVHAAASFFAPLTDRYARRLEPDVKVSLENILTPGTPEHQRWRAMCDRMAVFFHALEARGIPVIFRPFTEAYIGNFWYCHQKLGAEGFRRLYIDLHDYLTVEKQCNNILWDFQGGRSAPHFPGDAYVDIYTAKSEYRAWKIAAYQCLENDCLPMGNAELGDYGVSTRTDAKGKERIPWNTWVETIRRQCPRLAFYTIWYREWGPVKKADQHGRYSSYDSGYDELIANEYVVTRDEIPVTPKPPALKFRPGEGKWVTVRGDWTTAAASARRTDRKGEGKILFGNTDWSDYSIQAEVRITDAGEAGIMGRCASTDIYYLLSIHKESLTLHCRFNGQSEKLGEWTHPFLPGQSYPLKLMLRGDRIQGFVDTGSGMTARISVTDSTIPVGCFGFSSFDTPAEFTGISMAQ